MFKGDSEGTSVVSIIYKTMTKRVFITMNIGHIIKRNLLSVPLGLDSDIATIAHGRPRDGGKLSLSRGATCYIRNSRKSGGISQCFSKYAARGGIGVLVG